MSEKTKKIVKKAVVSPLQKKYNILQDDFRALVNVKAEYRDRALQAEALAEEKEKTIKTLKDMHTEYTAGDTSNFLVQISNLKEIISWLVNPKNVGIKEEPEGGHDSCPPERPFFPHLRGI